jgi:outer membrane protein assembly factor BamB
VRASPSMSPDGATVYVGSFDGSLHAISASTGLKQWSTPLGGVIVAAASVAEDGTIYVGSFDQSIYALEPDGDILWSQALQGVQANDTAIGPNGWLYVSQKVGFANGIPPTGITDWTVDIGSTQGVGSDCPPLVAEDGRVFIVSADGNVFGLTAVGQFAWDTPAFVNAPAATSLAVGPEGTLYFGAKNGTLYAIGL